MRGSLITEKVVLDAAHCSFSVLSKYFNGFGLDNISGHSQWSEEEWRKYVIIKVKEVISIINGQELPVLGGAGVHTELNIGLLEKLIRKEFL